MMKGTAFPKNSYRKPPSVKTSLSSETPTSYWSIWWIFVTKKWTEGWRDETAKRDESKRNSQRLGPLLLLRVPEPAIIVLSIIIIRVIHKRSLCLQLSLWGTTILILRAALIFWPVGDHGESTSVSKSRPNTLHLEIILSLISISEICLIFTFCAIILFITR